MTRRASSSTINSTDHSRTRWTFGPVVIAVVIAFAVWLVMR